MVEDLKQKLIQHLQLFQEEGNPRGLGLVVDRDGNYYFMGYAGMGNVQYMAAPKGHHFYPEIVELVNEGRFAQEAFEATYELGFKEVARLVLIKN